MPDVAVLQQRAWLNDLQPPDTLNSPKNLPPVNRKFYCLPCDPTRTCCELRPWCAVAFRRLEGVISAGQPAHPPFQNPMIHSKIQVATTAYRPLQLSAHEPGWVSFPAGTCVASLLQGITLFLSLKTVRHRIRHFIVLFFFFLFSPQFPLLEMSLCLALPLHLPLLLHYNQRQLLFLQIIQTSA